MARAWIGTSGWNYKHWRGDIYARGFAQRRWLEFIAERFDTVEVNTSFYRIPKPETVDAWVQGTPERFLFALKLWRGITHYRKLKGARELTQRFLDTAERVPENRRAPLLVQLPPNVGPDLARLEEWVAEFRELTETQWRIAVEFRADPWLEAPGVFEALARIDVGVCVHDMGGKGAATEPNDASFVYVRRHGYGALYAGNYGEGQIGEDAALVRKWVCEGRDVFVYYNNDIGGHAFRNALALRQAVSA